MDSISGRRIARELVDLRKAVRDLAGSPQLGNSSFESGQDQSIDELNPATGLPVASFGTQFDGTHGAIAFTSPTPPTPTTPELESQPGILSIGWDGFFLSDFGVKDITVVAPLGFAYVEVHAAPEAAGAIFDARSTATLIGTIGSARGGRITTGLSAGTYWVRLVARTSAGKPSEAGPAALVTVPALVDTEQLSADLVAAQDEISAAQDRLDAAEGEIDLAFGILDQVPTDIADAKQEAISAATIAAASDATLKADAAREAALTAVGLKGEIIVQLSAPTGTKAAPQNLWIRLPDNKPHRWNPASGLVNKWEAVTDQVAIDAAAAVVVAQNRADAAYTLAGTAKSTADSALSSANGKTKVYRSTSAPSGNGLVAGDIWWQYSSTAYSLVIGEWTWNGTIWVSQKQSHQTISSVDIGALTVVGTATISNAVALKIAAETASFQKADIQNLTVTGTSTMASLVAEKIAAQTAEFMYLTAQQIDVNQLWADLAFSNNARTHLLEVLTNSDGSGYTSRVTGQGLLVQYTVLDELGNIVDVQDVIRLGTFGSDYFAVSDNGMAVATIDKTGRGAFRALEASDSLSYHGVELQETLDKVGAGVYNYTTGNELDYGNFGGAGQVEIGSTVFYGLASVDFIVTGNRMVNIDFQTPNLSFAQAGGEIQFHCKIRTTAPDDTSAITEANSATFQSFIRTNPGSGAWHDHFLPIRRPILASESGQRIQILIMAMVVGVSYCRVFNKGRLTVTDGGELPPDPSVVKNSGGGKQYVASGTAPTVAPTTSKTTRVKEFTFTDVKSYLGTNAYYNYDVNRGYQGLQPYTGNGNMKSMFLFPDFASTISGSTINKIEVTMKFDHWYYNNGGVAKIYLHGFLSSLPASYSAASVTYSHDETGWGIGSTRTFRIPPSKFAGFLSGAYRGIALVGDGGYLTYGIASVCKIKFTYTK